MPRSALPDPFLALISPNLPDEVTDAASVRETADRRRVVWTRQAELQIQLPLGACAMRAMSALPCSIVLKAERFSHEDATAVAKWVLRRETAQTVVIDLSNASDASTAAFATLVLLRRKLLKRGRDLVVCGLRDRAQWIYVISRLTHVLPQQQPTDDDLPKPIAPAA